MKAHTSLPVANAAPHRNSASEDPQYPGTPLVSSASAREYINSILFIRSVPCKRAKIPSENKQKIRQKKGNFY